MLREVVQKHMNEVRLGVSTAIVSVGMALPTLTSYAEEVAGGSGSNLLEGEVLTAITNGFNSLVVTATQVMAIAVVTGGSVIGMSAAAKYAMKKMKGSLNTAA